MLALNSGTVSEHSAPAGQLCPDHQRALLRAAHSSPVKLRAVVAVALPATPLPSSAGTASGSQRWRSEPRKSCVPASPSTKKRKAMSAPSCSMPRMASHSVSTVTCSERCADIVRSSFSTRTARSDVKFSALAPPPSAPSIGTQAMATMARSRRFQTDAR